MAYKLTRLASSVNIVRFRRRGFIFAAAFANPTFFMMPAQAAGVCNPNFRIALDIGHTLARPGAISARGVPEFEYNRRLATAVDLSLRDWGVSTILIGQDGRPMGLAERTAIAATAGASALLSIHHDSVQAHYLSTWRLAGRNLSYCDLFSGYSLFVSAQNRALPESRRLAGFLGDALLASGQTPSLNHGEAISGENHPLLDPIRGIYRYDELAVLRTARMPAVLLEAAIIVNRRDEEALRSPEGLARTVSAVTQAILSYCPSHP